MKKQQYLYSATIHQQTGQPPSKPNPLRKKVPAKGLVKRATEQDVL